MSDEHTNGDEHETEDNNAAIVEAANRQLREQLENSAGAASTGPDSRTLQFTFDRQHNFAVAYLTAIFDGFQSVEEARLEMFQFALTHNFNVLGNIVQLRRSQGLMQSEGSEFPQGSVLVWRGGHHPLFGVDADGFWSVQMTYLLLPPWASLVE